QLLATLPDAVRNCIDLSAEAVNDRYDAVIYHGDTDQLTALCQQVAERSGPIAIVQGYDQGETNIALERFLFERSISVNTA
ncbi:hypothetical protein, partial [Rosenbergiella epipactidis]